MRWACLAVHIEIGVDAVAVGVENDFRDGGRVVRGELDVKEEELIMVGRSCRPQDCSPHHVHPARGQDSMHQCKIAQCIRVIPILIE